MSDEITLLCLVQGDKLDCGFLVTIKQSATIAHLKKAIQVAKPSFQQAGVNPNILQVWKVQIPLETLDEDNANRVELDDRQELKWWKRISFYWEEEPADDVLSIILRRPDGITITPSSSVESKLSSNQDKDKFQDQRPSKRRRSWGAEADEAIPEAFTLLWDTFWGRSATECFIEHAVKIPDSRTLDLSNDITKFTYLQLPGDSTFPCDLQQILITETYKSLYADLCAEDSRWQGFVGKSKWVLCTAHSTVITGQPGIGKTTGLSYILVRRLQDKKPTVYCSDNDFAYVFTDAGVQKMSCAVRRIAALDSSTNCCALVNIHPGMRGIPQPFHPSSCRQGRVVVAASPNPAHVKAFKERHARIYTLPTWGWDDLYCASMIINDPPLMLPDDEKLLDLFTIFRGIPRRCFRVLFGEEEEPELQGIRDAIDAIASITEFREAASGPLPFKKSSSHILVRVEPTDGRWGKPVTELLSKYVTGLVDERIRLHQSMTIRSSIDQLLRTSQARGWAGNLFEKVIHRRFRDGIIFHPEAMDNNSLPLEIKVDPVRSEADGYFHTLSVRKEARSRKVAINFLNQYLIPLSSTAETIDSVYISKSVTVLFQITVSASHNLNLKGITELTDELPFEAKKRICIVFVLPDHDTTLKPYKRQTIVVQAGTSQDIVTKALGYHQYVYYANLDGI